MNLSGSVTVVTGAARGIGLALCEALARAGGRGVMADLDGDGLAETARRLPPGAWVAMPGDVRRREDHAAWAARAMGEFGRLDAWVNNAGLARHMPVTDYREEDLDLNCVTREVVLRSLADRDFAGR